MQIVVINNLIAASCHPLHRGNQWYSIEEISETVNLKNYPSKYDWKEQRNLHNAVGMFFVLEYATEHGSETATAEAEHIQQKDKINAVAPSHIQP